jgi:methylated-DNA-[protein]-cysteine S-methyltransferase
VNEDDRALLLLFLAGEPFHPLCGRENEQGDQCDDAKENKQQNGKGHVSSFYTVAMKYCYAESPIGSLLIAGDDEAIHLIGFTKNGKPQKPEAGWSPSTTGALAEAVRQLREYFAGTRRDFDLPLAPEGTDFQRKVWRKLQEIPYGETISYGELAKRVGNPKASRAVGSANGKNRIPIVIPCHRVIAGDGGLGGFGGGLTTKEKLLALEGKKLALAAF